MPVFTTYVPVRNPWTEFFLNTDQGNEILILILILPSQMS